MVEIRDEAAYQAAMRTLSRQDRAPGLQRFLMNAVESYRSARKIGWSRPWNKYGINTYLSFKLGFPGDNDLITQARAVLADECSGMPGVAKKFADELLNDENLMGFIFLQEYAEDGQRYESATLSFGRRVQKRFRDRLDIILEAPVRNSPAGDTAADFSRLRVFIDPYAEQPEPIWQKTFDGVSSDNARNLFSHLGDLSWQWAAEKSRIWHHWTWRYIEYFGPRQWSVEGSQFAPVNLKAAQPDRSGAL